MFNRWALLQRMRSRQTRPVQPTHCDQSGHRDAGQKATGKTDPRNPTTPGSQQRGGCFLIGFRLVSEIPHHTLKPPELGLGGAHPVSPAPRVKEGFGRCESNKKASPGKGTWSHQTDAHTPHTQGHVHEYASTHRVTPHVHTHHLHTHTSANGCTQAHGIFTPVTHIHIYTHVHTLTCTNTTYAAHTTRTEHTHATCTHVVHVLYRHVDAIYTLTSLHAHTHTSIHSAHTRTLHICTQAIHTHRHHMCAYRLTTLMCRHMHTCTQVRAPHTCTYSTPACTAHTCSCVHTHTHPTRCRQRHSTRIDHTATNTPS